MKKPKPVSKSASAYEYGTHTLQIAGQSLTGPIAGGRTVAVGLENGIPNEILPLYDELRMTVDLSDASMPPEDLDEEEPGQVSGFEWLLPAKVIENEKRVNVDMIAMNGDITKNVTRQAFLAAWGQFFKDWKDYFAGHQTAIQLLIKGTGPAWRETENYRTQLVNWLTAFKREVPGVEPTLVAISEPGKPDKPETPKKPEGLSTLNIVLLTLLGVITFSAGGYYLWSRRGGGSRKPISPALLARDPVVSAIVAASPKPVTVVGTAVTAVGSGV